MIPTTAYRLFRRFVHPVLHKVCLDSGPCGKSHTASGRVDNKRKCSIAAPTLSSFPPGAYLKYLEVEGGTGLLETVSPTPMGAGLSGADSGGGGGGGAPHSTQHEAVLHSRPVHLSSKKALKIHSIWKDAERNDAPTEKVESLSAPLLHCGHRLTELS